MKIVDFVQGSDKWLDWRQLGLGSSDIAEIMGCGFGNKTNLFYEKSGFKDRFVNLAMRRGTEYEEEARQFICNRTGLLYTPVCIEHDEIPYFRASLDGYNAQDNSIIEIKVPSDPKVLDAAKNGIIPDRYKIQIQWQLMLSGARMCLYCVYDSVNVDCFELEVLPDPVMQANLHKEGQKFWQEFEAGILNDDHEEYLEFQGPEYDALEAEYRKAHLEAKLAEEALARIKSKIYDIADDGNFKFGKVKCTKVKGRESVDINKMKKDGLNLTKYIKFNPHYYKITLDK